jgi:hypothetical protein
MEELVAMSIDIKPDRVLSFRIFDAIDNSCYKIYSSYKEDIYKTYPLVLNLPSIYKNPVDYRYSGENAKGSIYNSSVWP